MYQQYLPSDYVLFDLETTGFSQNYDSIINIAALDVQNNVVVREFNTFIKPYKPIPKEITELTGITNDMVADAPPIWTALREFLSIATPDKTVLGHNVSFDCRFVNAKSWRFLGYPFNNERVDTLPLAKQYLPGLSSYKLTSLTQYLGINHENAHLAVADCYATKNLYDILKQKADYRQIGDNGNAQQISFF